jgi:hypothetical protein
LMDPSGCIARLAAQCVQVFRNVQINEVEWYILNVSHMPTILDHPVHVLGVQHIIFTTCYQHGQPRHPFHPNHRQSCVVSGV